MYIGYDGEEGCESDIVVIELCICDLMHYVSERRLVLLILGWLWREVRKRCFVYV